MRLIIRGQTFAIEDVPRDLDLSGIPRAYWAKRERTLRAHVREARRVEAELARRGVRLTDADVRAAAVEALEDGLTDGAVGVAAFGDPRALPELSRAFDAFEHLDCAVCDYCALLNLSNAIKTLGGSLTRAQRAKLAEYRRRQEGLWVKPPSLAELEPQMKEISRLLGIDLESLIAPRTIRLGRNDPCHCGSGLKYKKCHLGEDEARSGDAPPLMRH
ncbi:MAG TPA: SEC-C metal-binding domain-containing protein [Anaeromyxobacteraceae bacterium]|nr:SEC-C metal-binding domain-containing protein [Anaeromyxobacteraceae bacterium]